MEKLYINPTIKTPEINFSPGENIFLIRGISSPEDVRSLYYPVIDWFTRYISETVTANDAYSEDMPFRFRVDLEYFNSSTAKFLYDIFMELKRFIPARVPFVVEWVYDSDDLDLREAGIDIATLAGMEFTYVAK
jgi:hypothetical protein